jgi:hypothetical protein
MSDDLNHLKSLMDDAIPKPDAARRAANLSQAQSNFATLQQSWIATESSRWHRLVVWMQSGVGKGAVTASVVLVAAGLFFAAPPEPSQLNAPLATATKIGQSAQEGLVAEFAAPAPMMETDDAFVASRTTALLDRSAAPLTSYERVRAALVQGVYPSKDDVRIAEMVDAFTYDSESAITDENFAAAISRFGQLLHSPQALGRSGYDDVIALAQANLGSDPSGERAEAVMLMQLARDLSQ